MMTYETNITLIKETLQNVVKQLDNPPKMRLNDDTKASLAKMFNILLENSCRIERFYFIYLTCQSCANAKPNKVEKLLKAILPNPPNAQFMAIISDLISFALCHPTIYTNVLDNMSSYLQASDLVNVFVESWQQAETLAIDSPSFCSALISRSDLPKIGIEKKLLAKWLQDLSKVDQEFPPPSLNQLIRYSLFYSLPQNFNSEELYAVELANSDFHFGILTIIQSRRCQTLTNQFLIDVVSTLVQQIKSDNVDTKNQSHSTTTLVDRFAQILSVAAASKVTTITNALRNLLGELSSNQLIASVIQWPKK